MLSTNSNTNGTKYIYDLSGVVCHSGTLDSGHYITYIRRLICSNCNVNMNEDQLNNKEVPTDFNMSTNIEISLKNNSQEIYEWVK